MGNFLGIFCGILGAYSGEFRGSFFGIFEGPFWFILEVSFWGGPLGSFMMGPNLWHFGDKFWVLFGGPIFGLIWVADFGAFMEGIF